MLNNQIGAPGIGYAINSRPKSTATAAQIAAEMAKINPTLLGTRPVSTAYNPNPYTSNQLAQFNNNGLLGSQAGGGNPYYQQYLNKMATYGAGAGKTSPATQKASK